MKCFEDVVNMSKIDKVNSRKFRGSSLCSKDPTLHSSSSGIWPPKKMADLFLESYIYAQDDSIWKTETAK
jgi:hypothetical protein